MKLQHEALRWITSLTFLLLLLPLPLIAYPYPPWRVKSDGPLLSRFSATVRADSAWQEYPRPTLVRPPPSFQLLNGLWELDRFSDEAAAPPFKRHLPEQILVPFPVESALSGIRNQSIAGHLWYRRSVRLRANACAGKRVMLRFEACDWNTTVYVNEKVVGSHIGGYDAFAFDVSRVIDCNAENEIIVHVVDTTGSGRHSKEPQQILGKQSHSAFRRPGGIYYTGSSGIWQTVWIEFLPKTTHIEQVLTHIDDRHSNRVFFEVKLSEERSARMWTSAVIKVLEGNTVVASANGALKDGLIMLQMPEEAKWWTPERPFLYDVSVQVVDMRQKAIVDEASSYMGMRTIEVGLDKQGIPRPLLNGRFVFQVGTLDQGFWPDGIYSAPTDEALKQDVVAQKAMGFNLIRKHVKVEPRRWYYHCDRLGMLVWQDMPSARKPSSERDPTTSQFWKEAERHVQQLRVHPSIVLWVLFNEAWGQPGRAATRTLVSKMQALDASRLVDALSGVNFGGDTGVGSVIDLHHYSGPAALPFQGFRISALGEYGGVGLVIAEHSWAPRRCFMYARVESKQRLMERFRRQQREVLSLQKNRHVGLSASIYTQFTDVEAECNGLYSYDRFSKLDPEEVKSVNMQLRNGACNSSLSSYNRDSILSRTSYVPLHTEQHALS